MADAEVKSCPELAPMLPIQDRSSDDCCSEAEQLPAVPPIPCNLCIPTVTGNFGRRYLYAGLFRDNVPELHAVSSVIPRTA